MFWKLFDFNWIWGINLYLESRRIKRNNSFCYSKHNNHLYLNWG
jgi:hypothetical protein